MHPDFEPYLDDIYVIYASTIKEHAIYCIPIVDIVAEIREALTSGKKKIYFFNDAESLQPENLTKVQVIIDLLPEYPGSTFYYSTSAPYGQEFYDKWCEEHNHTKKLTIISADNFEHSMNQHLLYGLKPTNINEYEVRVKDKKFTCFNKIERLHRIKLLADMYKNNLVYSNFYSFEGGQKDWLQRLESARVNDEFGFDFKDMVNTIVQHRNDFPLRLNINEDRLNPIDLRVDDLQFINNSYFSIVTETYFYKDHKKYKGLCQASYYDTLFVSEKTYKCFALKHPFILLAFPNILTYLKQSGYKTFHPFIDESYDLILDDELRYQAVVKEILRLCAQSDSDWLEWQENIKPIVEHNYYHLLNKKIFHNIKDVDKLFL